MAAAQLAPRRVVHYAFGMRRPSTSGFSLVELSIVLVILGLLVGGILAGQSLIRASELRAVGTEYNRWQTAVHAFKDKYFALPGDMTNAQSFWGSAASCPGSNLTPSTDATTCNGDGDGVIEPNPGSGFGNEYFRYWQHLANAGLIEGSYAGVRGPTATIQSVRNFNVPSSRFSNGCWSSIYTDGAGSSNAFVGVPSHRWIVGRESADGSCRVGIATAEQIWNVDTKIDDGQPATGIVTPYARQECTNGTGSGDMNATYDLDDTTNTGCSFFIRARY